MAQVQEISSEGLKRTFVIKVPQDIVNAHWAKKLEAIAKKAKFDGFRPGKVPMGIVRQQYGAGARSEAVDEAIADVTNKTLTERGLRPALRPHVELISFTEDKDLEFKLALEVLPDVVPSDFTQISLVRPVAEVEEKTIDESIVRLAKAFRKPEKIDDDRSAIMGDVLVIDFDGTVDGTPRPGMKGEDHRLELGSGSFIDTFEQQLVGGKAGDQKIIRVTFPNDYHAADLSGKEAEFTVTIKEIRVHKPITMDDALAKEVGLPSMEKLRERITETTAANYANLSRTLAKRQLMDRLAEAHDFAVPVCLVDAEFGNIWAQIEDAQKQGTLPTEDKGKPVDALKAEYRAIAQRRVRLGLVLAEVAQREKITVSQEELRKALMDEMRQMPGHEKEVMDYYTQTPGAMERLRAPILEEKVTDHILSLTKITDEKVTADELKKRVTTEGEEVA